ncbi:MAG: tetratricopeptide repeat protein [Chitinophagaceae bacterium]|nr:tetratricopeptide repeat protein [Anaerolineae bacterium]
MTDFTPHEATAREALALPVMPPGRLVGRETALAQVYAQLKEGHAVLIHGTAGVGKTALAATLAGAYAQQPGGVLWFNVDNPRLEELLVRVGRAYNIPEIMNADNPLGMIAAVENTLKRSKPLIVIDGRISADVATRFITRCVDGLPTLIVGEAVIEGPWASLDLNPPETEQAVLLFKQESRLATTDYDSDVRQLVTLLGNLPLAIVVSARAMLASKQTPTAYLQLLQQVTNAVGGNPLVGALTASFRGLTAPLQGIILMMGATYDGRGSAELLSLISGAPVESVQQAMNILVQLSLAERTQRYSAPYYRLHPVIHAFAQSWLRGSNRLDDLQTKVQESILSYAKKYNAGTPDAYNKLATEIDSFLALAKWSAAKGERAISSELVAALSQAGDFVNERGYLYELLLLRSLGTTTTTAFPSNVAESTGAPLPFDAENEFEEEEYDEDFIDEADLDDEDLIDEDEEYDLEEDEVEDEGEDEEVLQPLASRLFNNPLDGLDGDDDDLIDDDIDDDEEVLSAALPITPITIDLNTDDITKLRAGLVQARQSSDKQTQLRILQTIGQLQVNQDMENEAIATYGEALTLQESMNDQDGILETLDMLSALMVKTDNSQAAVMYATRGAKMAESLKDEVTRMQLLITLGDARQQLGESDQAENDYGYALEIARTSDDSQNEALILYKLGYALLDTGDSDAAVDTWEQALQLFKAQEKRDYEGRVLGALGSAYGDLARWSEAVNFHTSALYIAREVGDKEEEALQLSSLGYASVQANQLGQAVMRYRQALYLAYQNDDRDNIVSTIVDLSRLLVESRKHITVAELLVNEAVSLDPSDKDVRQLKERIESEKKLAEAYEVAMISVNGSARQYAENAYKLL